MQHDPRKLLHDISTRIDGIQRFTAGKIFDDYKADEILRLAVERQFEIIGEAISRLLKVDAALTARIADYRKIIDFRNVITHGYDLVDDQLVWDAVVHKLPTLKRDVDAILNSLP